MVSNELLCHSSAKGEKARTSFERIFSGYKSHLCDCPPIYFDLDRCYSSIYLVVRVSKMFAEGRGEGSFGNGLFVRLNIKYLILTNQRTSPFQVPTCVSKPIYTWRLSTICHYFEEQTSFLLWKVFFPSFLPYTVHLKLYSSCAVKGQVIQAGELEIVMEEMKLEIETYNLEARKVQPHKSLKVFG